MAVTLQHSLLPQVDPNDLPQLPLGVGQVGQDTSQGLGNRRAVGERALLSPPPPQEWTQAPWGGHLGAGLGHAIDGHTGHPPKVRHIHLSDGAEGIRGDKIIGSLRGEQQAWDPQQPREVQNPAQGRLRRGGTSALQFTKHSAHLELHHSPGKEKSTGTHSLDEEVEAQR